MHDVVWSSELREVAFNPLYALHGGSLVSGSLDPAVFTSYFESFVFDILGCTLALPSPGSKHCSGPGVPYQASER